MFWPIISEAGREEDWLVMNFTYLSCRLFQRSDLTTKTIASYYYMYSNPTKMEVGKNSPNVH